MVLVNDSNWEVLVKSFKPLLLAYRLAAGTQKCFVNRGQVVGCTHGDTLRVLVHFAKGEDQSLNLLQSPQDVWVCIMGFTFLGISCSSLKVSMHVLRSLGSMLILTSLLGEFFFPVP